MVLVDGVRVGELTWWRGAEGALDAWYFEDDVAGSLEQVCSLTHSRGYAEGACAKMLEERRRV